MSSIIELPTFKDPRGSLSVAEKVLPFEIKRFYMVYDVTSIRGGHRHKKTWQALICLGGSCEIYVNNGKEKESFVLDRPGKCLILHPEDWHTMDHFTSGSTLLVLASEYYSKDDYIDDPYENEDRL